MKKLPSLRRRDNQNGKSNPLWQMCKTSLRNTKNIAHTAPIGSLQQSNSSIRFVPSRTMEIDEMSGEELTLIFNEIDDYIQDSNSKMHRLWKPIQDYDKTVSKVNVI